MVSAGLVIAEKTPLSAIYKSVHRFPIAFSSIAKEPRERTKPPRDGCGGFTEVCAACWDRQEFAGINSLQADAGEVERGVPEKGPDSRELTTRSAHPCLAPG